MEDKETYRQRFENLIKSIEEGGRSRFDMITWGYRARKKEQTACALGHYASRRDLQQAFMLDRNGNVRQVGTGYDGYEPALSHFGINHAEFQALFGHAGCGQAFRSRKLALAWLKRFVHDRFYKPKEEKVDDVAV